MTEVQDLPGWTGDTISLENQAAVILRYYQPALDTILRSLAFLHKDTRLTLEGAGPAEYIDKLTDNPFFVDVMNSLVENHEKFGDGMFRMSERQLGQEAKEELRDFITYTCVMLWIADGAEFPNLEEDAGDEEE